MDERPGQVFSRRVKLGLATIGLATTFAITAWLALPQVVASLPSQFRQRLPGELLRLVTTPLPAALPAPVVSAELPSITIPAHLPATSTFAPTPTLARPTETTPFPETPSGLSSVETATAATTSATPRPTATKLPPTPTAVPPPTAHRLTGIEIIPQKFNNCGPTNLSITLAYFGYEVGQLDIAAVLRPNYDDRNVSPEELVRYTNENTPLRASVHWGGDLLLLKRLIAAGFPVIIEKGLIPSEWEGWMGHYLTLFGYDDGRKEFYSMDTFLGPWDSSGRADSYEEVARYWAHFDYTFIVVYPAKQEAEVREILSLEMTDVLAMWQGAALRALEETEAKPDDAFAWFNLGTNMTRLGTLIGEEGYFASAVGAFDRAREIGLPARMLWYQFDPYVAYLEMGRVDDVLVLTQATMAGGGRDVEETYLYRGHALMAMGDTTGARAAYRTALELNPNFEAARVALEGR